MNEYEKKIKNYDFEAFNDKLRFYSQKCILKAFAIWNRLTTWKMSLKLLWN